MTFLDTMQQEILAQIALENLIRHAEWKSITYASKLANVL